MSCRFPLYTFSVDLGQNKPLRRNSSQRKKDWVVDREIERRTDGQTDKETDMSSTGPHWVPPGPRVGIKCFFRPCPPIAYQVQYIFHFHVQTSHAVKKSMLRVVRDFSSSSLFLGHSPKQKLSRVKHVESTIDTLVQPSVRARNFGLAQFIALTYIFVTIANNLYNDPTPVI